MFSYIPRTCCWWWRIKYAHLVLIGLALNIINSIPVAESLCPLEAVDENNYAVSARFEKFKKAIGENKVQKSTFIHRGKEEYDYELTLCPAIDTKYVAVLQKSKQSGTTTKLQVIGRSNNSFVTGGVDWLLIVYGDGDPYNNHCGQNRRHAWITIRCEKENRVEMLRVIEEKREEKDDLCYYLFEYNHPAACSGSSVKTLKKLGGGSIFCIVIVCIAAAYLIGGFLYQRFYAGAKGFEQIPNYSFWREVGNLSSDGCDFVCRRPDHPANTYKGMTDALNIDSSDDEKDDHLLPM